MFAECRVNLRNQGDG